MGDSPKWVKSRRRRKKRERERAKVGDNNGQATHGARKPPGPIISHNQRTAPYLMGAHTRVTFHVQYTIVALHAVMVNKL